MEKDINAIDMVRQMVADGQVSQEVAEKYFPELKEIEDERIRKELISFFTERAKYTEDSTFGGLSSKEIIAWLEKQGEQNLANSAKTCKDEQNPNPCDGCVNRKGCINCENGELREKDQKSTAWSEDDEKVLNLIIARLHSHPNVEAEEYDKDYHWLKSLRPQNRWKPSEEQMDALRYVTNFDYGGHKATLVSLYEQLKKLKDEK